VFAGFARHGLGTAAGTGYFRCLCG
jgi:hypothetical protein